MAIDTRLLGQVKQALAKKLVKQAAPPTFPAEGPNPAAAPAKPAPAPTTVDKAISTARASAPTGPTSADLAIQAPRRQNALGNGQLVTGTTPGASMAAPDYASARQLDDLARSEAVRANMQNAGKYVADAASSAVGYGRSALDNAAAIRKHVDHATSSPVGYLAALGQRSGSPMLDRMGTALVEAQAAQAPLATTVPTATAANSTPAATTAYYSYPPVPASGNYNDPASRFDVDNFQPTYQQQDVSRRRGGAMNFPGQILKGRNMTGFDPTTPIRPYMPTITGMQPSAKSL